MSESDVHAAVDVSDSVRVGKGDCRKYGFMGLSGNAGRSRHGVGSKEGAASARRVEQAALSRRNTGLESLCAQRSFTLLFREEWRAYNTAQRVSTAGCTGDRPVFLHPPDKKN